MFLSLNARPANTNVSQGQPKPNRKLSALHMLLISRHSSIKDTVSLWGSHSTWSTDNHCRDGGRRHRILAFARYR